MSLTLVTLAPKSGSKYDECEPDECGHEAGAVEAPRGNLDDRRTRNDHADAGGDGRERASSLFILS